MEKVTLQVQGMSCNHCVNAIESNVAQLDGVKKVHVQLAEKKVDVEFDSSKVSLAQVKKEIEEQGYDVM